MRDADSDQPIAIFDDRAARRPVSPTQIPPGAQLLAKIVAVFVGVMGTAVLAGWMFDVAVLKSVGPGLEIVKANTALGFVIGAAALTAAVVDRPDRWLRAARVAAPLLILGIGLTTLVQYVTGLDLLVDRLMFVDAALGPNPGRMSLITAVNFTLLGVALLLAPAEERTRPVDIMAIGFLVLCFIGLGSSFLATIGYAYDIPVLYRPVAYAPIALPTTLAFMAMFVAVLALRAEIGIAGLLRSRNAGGAITRRLLPAIILLPPFLGWVILNGELAALYDIEGALAYFALASVAIFTAIVWQSANHIERLDVARQRTEADLRATEARFLAFVENAPFVTYLKDRDGRYLFHNREAERVLGRKDAELKGRTVHDVSDAATAAEVEAMDRKVLETGQPQVFERHRPSADRYAWVVAIKFPIRDESGAIVAIGGFDVDITERRQVQEALDHSAAMLQRAQRMESVGQLTAGIAHDFNNMLTVVIGTLELALESADDRLRLPLASALKAADHGAELVRRLLAFARRQPLNPTDLDTNELVSGMTPLLRRALGEDVEIELKLAPDLARSRADAAQLESVIMNLAVNGRDAMPAGGKLTIETSNQYLDADYAADNVEVEPGDYTMLAVTDTGAGMPPEVAARAFEPFFTTKEFGKGSGLGLSMVYGFAKQSGGHVKIYSEVGHGTEVRLYLPAADAVTAAALTSASGEAPAALRGRETILVVEDDARVRAFVVSQLAALGYRVLDAANGPEAQRILDSDVVIDLLFTDVVMPGGMTGRQLSDAARLRRPGLKTLFTSGYTENSVFHQGKLDAGIHFLPKPHKRDLLARKVREVLDRG